MSPVLAALLVIVAGVAAIVLFTLRLKLPAFFALLIVAIVAGLAFGAKPDDIIAAIRKGMGDTLGFVAPVIGLGAILGALLEASGGVARVAGFMLDRTPERAAPWILALVGVIVGAPLFFEVAFVILAPLLLSLTDRSKKGVMFFALPALVGLALMHGLLPPHPGAIASAEALHADYGRVMLFGLACGVPGIAVAGPLLTLAAFNKARGPDWTPPVAVTEESAVARIGVGAALVGMLTPVVLILIGAFVPALLPSGSTLGVAIKFIGHPFVALVLACLYAWILLGVVKKTPLKTLGPIMGRALEPAGAISLVIGAGAAFKQVIVSSGVGDQLTAAVTQFGLTPLVFGFALSAILRVAQGSATVAIVTSAGLTAPLVAAARLDPNQTALVCIAIGAGAIILSHVNDAGFWLIKQYLGISEAAALRSWTVACTIGGLIAFALALGLSQIV